MRRLVTIGLLAAIVGLSACLPPPPPPSGRYADEIFGQVSVQANLTYGAAPDEFGQTQSLELDLYQPAGDTLASRPVIVWVHGGGFVTGNKSGMSTYATRFAKRGYVTVSIEYRLREGADIGFDDPGNPIAIQAVLDAQHDAQAAVRWLRANAATYRLDPSRIAIGGSSAGAITAMMVSYNAVDPGSSGNPGYPSDVAAGVSLAGCEPATGLINGGEPPTLLIHGTADTTVPYSCAVATRDAALAVGDYSLLVSRLGVGHGVSGNFDQNAVDIVPFLYTQVIED
jgi:para-nitrobenzyl esterase